MCDEIAASPALVVGMAGENFRSDSGYRTYSITAMRITSGDELKQLNGLAGLVILPFYQHPAPTEILV